MSSEMPRPQVYGWPLSPEFAVSTDDISAVRLVKKAAELQSQQFPLGHRFDLFEHDFIALIFEGEQCVSMGAIDVAEDKGNILVLVTDSGHRKRGLGSKVLRMLEQLGDDRGVKTLTLMPLPAQTEFYEKRGYIAANNGTGTMYKNTGI